MYHHLDAQIDCYEFFSAIMEKANINILEQVPLCASKGISTAILSNTVSVSHMWLLNIESGLWQMRCAVGGKYKHQT